MDDTGSSEFKMRMDDDGPDREMQDEIEDHRISKLSQRVTLISILIPCLIGSILLFVYLDIQDNVTTTFDTESKAVRSLTKSIDSRISTLSSQNDALKTDVAGTFSGIEKTIASLKGRIEKNRKTADRTKKTAASKKALSSAVSKTDKSFAAIREDLAVLSTDVRDFQDTMAQELTRLSEAMDAQTKSVENLRVALSELSSEKIDKRDLYVLLEDRQKAYQQRVGQMIKGIEKELAAAEKRIRVLEKKNNSPGTRTQVSPAGEKTSPPVVLPQPKSGNTDLPSDQTTVPAPGTIIEQDIQ